ncbi:hypothetical protein EPUS_02954 [Endocarpon pusillum Z07020]|uniref:FAD/NAD(P)-binding domain-containing protein n=1 Tax=Endocarpon pusillum (strain Z07020 / HMAS-L-300199) TaxID=1263415 RepID=U1GJ54_ENDPU|nr:uncharacterized protein EPUS_02954 [Endocarpon pusillum Z07020]ERF72163.1 hypothetical protein EPUS_02954 [Endocarpon pusillum Z07020]
MTFDRICDVLIIGSGPAGLSSALALARALYNVIVFDSGVYRNQSSPYMHTLPTWDHRDPKEYRDAARAEVVTRYDTVKFHDSAVESIQKTEQGFEALTADGQTWTGRKVILASGVKDIMPDIEGYDSCWVKGIYHCLFCKGYEDRGAASAGVLAIDDVAAVPPALHLARSARRLASTVTLYTNGAEDLAHALKAGLHEQEKAHIHTDTRPIAKLIKTDQGSSVTICFRDDSSPPATEGFLVHRPKMQLNGPCAQQLKLKLTPQGDIQTTPPFGETSVQGVFAAGDCAASGKIVANALSMGAFASAGVAAQLQASPF